jgi:MFS superfamily sulfate permease-like transporter
MIALSVTGSIDLSSTLVFSGLANIITGVVFGVPLPVQPMKAIAAVAISQKFTKDETAAAGLVVSFAVLALGVTGLLHWLHRVVPVPVVKGIQVGAGLSLAISAGSTLIQPLAWHTPALDNRLWAAAAFLILITATLVPRFPYALLVFLLGLVLAASQATTATHAATFWHPHPFIPSRETWLPSALDAALPQLPLTTLNSILAVTSLSASLFPSFPPPPSTTSLGLSVALSNLIGCWFGAMPVCHGSGGLAGQYRFGARSGASIIFLGSVKLLLGLFAGEAVVPLLRRFPKSLLGVMVLAAGVELAKVGQSVGDSADLWARVEREQAIEAETGNEDDGRAREEKRAWVEKEGRERWMVMLVTAAGCLAFKNDAVGFLAGLCWHYGLLVPGWVEGRRRSVRLERTGEEEGTGLMGRS